MSVSILQEACNANIADPSLGPSGGSTFCNVGAERVAQAMGCDELDNQMADQMFYTMRDNASGRWEETDGPTAADHAQRGGLAFAAMSAADLREVHGHIAPVYPAPTEYSPSLSKDVPVLANVGRTVGIMKASEAFPVALGEPSYFCWS